jgi:hypothetical protein
MKLYHVSPQRELATTLDALIMTRDRLREEGLTGNDCQTAWDKIASLVRPNTWGVAIRVADRLEA